MSNDPFDHHPTRVVNVVLRLNGLSPFSQVSLGQWQKLAAGLDHAQVAAWSPKTATWLKDNGLLA